MAGGRNSEGVVTAVKTVLSAGTGGLDDMMGTVDAEYNDDITLETVAEYLEAHPAEMDEWPTVVIVAPDTDIPGRTGHYGEHWHTVRVWFLTLSRFEDEGSLNPQENLTRRINRSLEAIQRVLEANPRLTIDGTDYADRLFVRHVTRPDFIDKQGTEDDEDWMTGYGYMDVEVQTTLN